MDERFGTLRCLREFASEYDPRTVCQSQKSPLRFNGIFGGRKIGKPIDDKGFLLFPRERQSPGLFAFSFLSSRTFLDCISANSSPHLDHMVLRTDREQRDKSLLPNQLDWKYPGGDAARLAQPRSRLKRRQ
jgi:hypothetical protein